MSRLRFTASVLTTATNRQRSAGAALILVLMIVALMSVVTISALKTNQLLVKEARLLKQSTQASLAIQDVKIDLVNLLTTTPMWLMGPDNKTFLNNRTKQQYQLPSAFNFYGYPFRFPYDDGDTQVSIQDLSGVVSLYPLDERGLKKLILLFGHDNSVAISIVDSIADWIDGDDLVRLNGAEKLFYIQKSNYTQKNNRQNSPRNGPIQTLDELLLIKNMTTEIWQQIKPYLSLFGDGVMNVAYVNNAILPVVRNKYQTEQIIVAREKQRAEGQLFSKKVISGRDLSTNELYGSELAYPSRRLRIKIMHTVDGTLYQQSFILVRTRGVIEPFIITDVVMGEYE